MSAIKRKILLVSNHLPPIVDGVGDHVALLAKHLAEKGLEVHVLCSNKVQNINYPVVQGWQVYPMIGKWNHFWALCQYIYLLRLIKPDHIMWHVVAYGFHPYGLPFVLPILVIVSRIYAPTSVFFHEVRIKINPLRWKSLVIGLPMWSIMGLTHWLSSFSFTSNGGYQRLLQAYGKKARILRIPSNVPIEKVSFEFVQQVKANLGLSKKFVLGTFGMGIRGREILHEALKELQNKFDNLAFMAIGKIPSIEIQELQETLPSIPVISTGFVDSKDVACYMQVLDLYLMLEPTHSPDQWNGSSTRSTTLATALNLGVPVLGSKGELNDDFIRDLNIVLINNLNVENLVGNITSIRSRYDVFLINSAKSQSIAIEQLSWQQYVDKFVNLVL
jgi:glycosyltransferase involved in cell wall biosynthesis